MYIVSNCWRFSPSQIAAAGQKACENFSHMLGEDHIFCHKLIGKLLDGWDGVDEKAVKAAFHPVAVIGFFDKAADVGDGVFASRPAFFRPYL